MTSTKTLGQGIRYLLVGGGSALIDVGLFQMLFLLGLGAVPSNVTSLLISTIFNFSMNRSVTFKSTANPLRSAILYILLLAFNMCFSSIVISLMIDSGIHSLFAKIIALAFTTCWNFFLYRKVVFPSA